LGGVRRDLRGEVEGGLDGGKGGGEKEKGGVYSHETLRAEDVYREMMGMVEEVAKVVNVPQDDVLRLLSRYEWDTAKFQEGFFADFEDNMETVCSQRGEGEVAGAGKCLVCFEEFPREELFDCGCAHGFCKECWGGYISSKVEDASTCLRIDCPQPDCSRLVKGSLMAKIAAPEHLKKIKMASIANFADKMGYICVCPGVDCTRYIKVPEHEKGVLVKDVRCSWCHTDFCFDCLGEAHRPISCELVHQWDLKNTTDRANMDWIVSHTKPCPSCNRPIEKNKGCMHMHCTRCGFHFCWLCMGDWNKHGESTGGYYNCTLFEKQKKEQDPNEKKREAAKKSLNRHLQFFERWSEHDRAMKILIKAKDEWENVEGESVDREAYSRRRPAVRLRGLGRGEPLSPRAQVDVCGCVFRFRDRLQGGQGDLQLADFRQGFRQEARRVQGVLRLLQPGGRDFPGAPLAQGRDGAPGVYPGEGEEAKEAEVGLERGRLGRAGEGL